MEDSLSSATQVDADGSTQGTAKDWLAEMERLQVRIHEDQAEINRLKSDTRATLARIEANLDRLEVAA